MNPNTKVKCYCIKCPHLRSEKYIKNYKEFKNQRNLFLHFAKSPICQQFYHEAEQLRYAMSQQNNSQYKHSIPPSTSPSSPPPQAPPPPPLPWQEGKYEILILLLRFSCVPLLHYLFSAKHFFLFLLFTKLGRNFAHPRQRAEGQLAHSCMKTSRPIGMKVAGDVASTVPSMAWILLLTLRQKL